MLYKGYLRRELSLAQLSLMNQYFLVGISQDSLASQLLIHHMGFG
jgi:hypothetical protein